MTTHAISARAARRPSGDALALGSPTVHPDSAAGLGDRALQLRLDALHPLGAGHHPSQAPRPVLSIAGDARRKANVDMSLFAPPGHPQSVGPVEPSTAVSGASEGRVVQIRSHCPPGPAVPRVEPADGGAGPLVPTSPYPCPACSADGAASSPAACAGCLDRGEVWLPDELLAFRGSLGRVLEAIAEDTRAGSTLPSAPTAASPTALGTASRCTTCQPPTRAASRHAAPGRPACSPTTTLHAKLPCSRSRRNPRSHARCAMPQPPPSCPWSLLTGTISPTAPPSPATPRPMGRSGSSACCARSAGSCASPPNGSSVSTRPTAPPPARRSARPTSATASRWTRGSQPRWRCCPVPWSGPGSPGWSCRASRL